MLILFACLGISYHTAVIQFDWRFLLIIIILACWYVHATTVNDISDVEIDKINLKAAKGRPLVHNQVSVRTLWQLNILAELSALVGAAFLGRASLLVVSAGLVLNYIYSLRPIQLSHRGYLAPLALPLGYVVIPYLLGSLNSGATLTSSLNLLLLGLYIAFVGRIILKDIRDIKGDKQFGKNTLVVMHGKAATCLVSAVFWLAGDIVLLKVIATDFWIIAAFEILFVLIFVCLYCLKHADAHNDEQVYIGLVAMAANGILVCLITLFLLPTNVVAARQVILLLSIMFSTSIIYGLWNPEKVRLGYKG